MLSNRLLSWVRQEYAVARGFFHQGSCNTTLRDPRFLLLFDEVTTSRQRWYVWSRLYGSISISEFWRNRFLFQSISQGVHDLPASNSWLFWECVDTLHIQTFLLRSCWVVLRVTIHVVYISSMLSLSFHYFRNAACKTASPQYLLSSFDSFNNDLSLSSIVRFMRSDSPFHWGLYGEDVISVIHFRFRLFIIKNSFVLSQWTRLTLELVFLSSHVTWSKHSYSTPFLVFKGSTTVYRCGVIVIERNHLLSRSPVFSNGPHMSKCMVIYSAFFELAFCYRTCLSYVYTCLKILLNDMVVFVHAVQPSGDYILDYFGVYISHTFVPNFYEMRIGRISLCVNSGLLAHSPDIDITFLFQCFFWYLKESAFFITYNQPLVTVFLLFVIKGA